MFPKEDRELPESETQKTARLEARSEAQTRLFSNLPTCPQRRRGKGLSIRRDSWDDALVLFPAAFSLLAALAACLASCLASCFITCLSIFFACCAVSSKRSSSGHQGPIGKQRQLTFKVRL